MVRSIWLAAYFLISLLTLAALKLSLAVVPAPHDGSAAAPSMTVAAPTVAADIAEARPLAKSDRLPIAIAERAPVDAITRFAVLDPAPSGVVHSAAAAKPASVDATLPAEASAPQKPAKTAAGRPWRNAYAEKSAHRSHRHGPSKRRHRHRHSAR